MRRAPQMHYTERQFRAVKRINMKQLLAQMHSMLFGISYTPPAFRDAIRQASFYLKVADRAGKGWWRKS